MVVLFQVPFLPLDVVREIALRTSDRRALSALSILDKATSSVVRFVLLP